ncbi:MAG: tetratricopeptide repeat protein [Magnetovibrio sp.]|nr:tetratricopeptide repeat protein [Magnetovibrio sp.]
MLGTIGGGLAVDRFLNPPAPTREPVWSEPTKKVVEAAPKKVQPLDAFGEHFQAAAKLLAVNKYAEALEMLELTRRIRPHVPEVQVNIGFAYLGQGKPQKAAQAFDKAMSMRSTQLNAYYGLAVALEQMGDLEGALGAIQTYVHLAKDDDPFRRKAMSAQWEWREALKIREKEDRPAPPPDSGDKRPEGVK